MYSHSKHKDGIFILHRMYGKRTMASEIITEWRGDEVGGGHDGVEQIDVSRLLKGHA